MYKPEINVKLENAVNRLIEALAPIECCYMKLKVKKNYSSYWEHKGKYEKMYHELYEKLVPKKYGCSHKPSEALRILSKAYYRYYNDGDKVQAEVYKLVKEAIKILKS